MASGLWSETNKPIRPGFYNRIIAKALARIQMGPRGIVAMPVKANWGPTKEIVRITGENGLINNFGTDNTAYKLGRLALLGQPKELLLYRLVDGTESPASASISGILDGKDIEEDIIRIKTKYPTTRKFHMQVAPDLKDESETTVTLFEGTRKLMTVSGLKGNLGDVIREINDSSENSYIVAESSSAGTKDSAVSSISHSLRIDLTGGNDGAEDITNEDYLEAMSAFEGRYFNGFTLDGISDSSLHTSVKAWCERLRRHGRKIRVFIGGPKEQTLEEALNKSRSLNYEGIHNIISIGILDGVEYAPAETAVYVCALGEGIDMKESLCNMETVFQDVANHLTHEEFEDVIRSGSIALRYDEGVVVIEDDLNTLSRYSAEQNETWSSLRAIRFMDMVDEDTSRSGNRNYVGKVINGAAGRQAVLSALKQYFEILRQGGLIDEYLVREDDERNKTGLNDEFYWLWDVDYNDVMKRIFSTGRM